MEILVEPYERLGVKPVRGPTEEALIKLFMALNIQKTEDDQTFRKLLTSSCKLRF